jgi:hypothetical protein
VEDDLSVLGKWWLPGRETEVVAGLLDMSDEDPCLHLVGSFAEPPRARREERRYPIINGHRRGGLPRYTLVAGQSFGAALPGGAENIWCSTVIEGAALGADELFFPAASVRFSHLVEWAHGMPTTAPLATVPGWRHDQLGSAALPDGTEIMLRRFDEGARGQRGDELTEQAAFDIKPPQPLGIEGFEAHVRTLQDMMTFVTNAPNYVEQQHFRVGDSNSAEAFMRSPYHRIGARAEARSWFEMLLHGANPLFKFGDFVPLWYALYSSLGTATDRLFASDYVPHYFADDQFFVAVQALEAVHRRLYQPDADRLALVDEKLARLRAAITELPPAEQRSVDRLVTQRWREPALEERLRMIVQSVAPAMASALPDPPVFAQRAASLRNYMAHWLDPDERIPRPTGGELADLASVARGLCRALLLQHLGFTPEDSATLFSRTREFASLELQPPPVPANPNG